MINKKHLLILVVLLAVIGLVGAGCLGSNNDDNATNGTNNGTGFATDVNSTNTSDTSNNTSNNSNTSGASNNSDLPDVVYANQGSGGGGRGSSTPVPTETTAKFGSQPLVVEEYVEYIEGEGDEEDQTIYLVYVYVPTSDMETGDTLSVTFLQSVTGAIEMDGEDVIEDIEDGVLFSDIQVKGKVVTTTLKQEEIDFGEWNDFNLGVLIGDDVYLVSFYASTIWNFDLPTGASARIVEIGDEDYTELTVTGKKTVVTDSKVSDVRVTVFPPSGKTVISVTANPELPVTTEPFVGLNGVINNYSDVDSSIYNITSTFEAKTKATINGQSLWVDQYLVDTLTDNSVLIFVPALDVLGEDIVLTFTDTVTEAPTVLNTDLIDAAAPVGNTVTVSINETAEVEDFSNEHDWTKGLTVEAGGKTYTVYIMAASIWNFDVGPNGYLIFDKPYALIEGSYSGVSHAGIISHYLDAYPNDGYVVDTFTITAKDGTVLFDNEGNPDEDFFYSDEGDIKSTTYTVKLTFKKEV